MTHGLSTRYVRTGAMSHQSQATYRATLARLGCAHIDGTQGPSPWSGGEPAKRLCAIHGWQTVCPREN